MKNLAMQTFIDMIGCEVLLQSKPKRIVSLVPSQTELLFDLGLENEVVGITKFCIHPEQWFRTKTRVGGTKNVNIEKVAALQPNLIIANKEENTKSDIEALRQIAPVWTSDILTLDDACQMIRQIGLICDKAAQADIINQKIKADFNALPFPNLVDNAVAYFIWFNPLMLAASDTFIDDILSRLGFRNSFAHQARYPEIDWEVLKAQNPDYILLSSEPFPFKEKHIDEFKKCLPNATVLLVDGEMFSWYGSRLQHAVAYFKTLFLPKLSV